MTTTNKTAFNVPHMDKLPRGEAGIVKAFASIKARGAKLQMDVHIAACAVLRHIEEHNDIRLVAKLLEVLPGSYRTNALRDWFMAYGPIAFDKNKPRFVKDKPVELTKAMADPFWLFSAEPEYQPMDIAATIAALIKKLDADAVKTNRDHSAIVTALEAVKPATEPRKPVAVPASQATVTEDVLAN